MHNTDSAENGRHRLVPHEQFTLLRDDAEVMVEELTMLPTMSSYSAVFDTRNYARGRDLTTISREAD